MAWMLPDGASGGNIQSLRQDSGGSQLDQI